MFAPCDASVDLMFDTGHAVSLVADFGAEILIHVGLDTVNLKGEHFNVHVKTGDKVKKGDLLIEFDVAAIAAAGYDVITPLVICNTLTTLPSISMPDRPSPPATWFWSLVSKHTALS